jgi:hypothetical protein
LVSRRNRQTQRRGTREAEGNATSGYGGRHGQEAEAAAMKGKDPFNDESRHQIEESRRLIERTRALLAEQSEEITRSVKALAEAQRLLASLKPR